MKRPPPSALEQAVVVDLTAVIVGVSDDQPKVLVLPRRGGTGPLEALPSGPLQLRHRTLEAGLRAWVEAQTGASLGYVEQLYTFGDQDRAAEPGGARRVLSIGYLALTRAAASPAPGETEWRDWYRYFPWEDWRQGRPAVLGRLERGLRRWVTAARAGAERGARSERVRLAFGLDGAAWSDERVLDRYELLYEIGLVAEAMRQGVAGALAVDRTKLAAQPMAADHRRILATAIARLRSKIKYRPVVFELMAPTFTFLQLQRAVETLAGVRLHKQNFRRLVSQRGLVEETGSIVTGTGGRPARELRYRQEAILERPAPGVRLPAVRGE
ncbi:MAG: hypothetical protein EXQ95_02095 [Alphaproteobacteria bacterium]|nr:hypothetical protein [Alphaproteobacteria bacterium]